MLELFLLKKKTQNCVYSEIYPPFGLADLVSRTASPVLYVVMLAGDGIMLAARV